MIPSIGRIVHFHKARGSILDGFIAYAAVILEAEHVGKAEVGKRGPEEENNYSVFLLVHKPATDARHTHVPFSATPKDGHWSWPPRV